MSENEKAYVRLVEIDSTNNRIIAPGKTIALIGIEDIDLVCLDDTIVITKREKNGKEK